MSCRITYEFPTASSGCARLHSNIMFSGTMVRLVNHVYLVHVNHLTKCVVFVCVRRRRHFNWSGQKGGRTTSRAIG